LAGPEIKTDLSDRFRFPDDLLAISPLTLVERQQAMLPETE
jgi:hypothetical protein